jgi:NAD(P)H-flavin reductase
VVAIVDETPHCRSLVLDVPNWPGHRAGQHVDIRLTAEDGYQVQRSYSIASPPEVPQITLTVERLDDGEVSPYLTEVLQVGDTRLLRIVGCFLETGMMQSEVVIERDEGTPQEWATLAAAGEHNAGRPPQRT